jgi:hypothetical protein
MSGSATFVGAIIPYAALHTDVDLPEEDITVEKCYILHRDPDNLFGNAGFPCCLEVDDHSHHDFSKDKFQIKSSYQLPNGSYRLEMGSDAPGVTDHVLFYPSNVRWEPNSATILLVQHHDSDKFAACVATATCNNIQLPHALTMHALPFVSDARGETDVVSITNEFDAETSELDRALLFLQINNYITDIEGELYQSIDRDGNDSRGESYNFEEKMPPFFYVLCDILLPATDEASPHAMSCVYRPPCYYLMGGERKSKVGRFRDPRVLFFTDDGRDALKEFVASVYGVGSSVTFGEWQDGKKGENSYPRPVLVIPKMFTRKSREASLFWSYRTFTEIKKDLSALNVYNSDHFQGPYSVQVLSIAGEMDNKYFVDLDQKGADHGN